ncbi:rna-directed dna polymerase from mobile element jockey-like [Pitangus sulphuratus]|nr:rna-directed dna polymerase from mobile element jockey-like [Pitangus sulphuratus]
MPPWFKVQKQPLLCSNLGKDMDEGIESIISKFTDDTELCRSVDLLQGSKDRQRDLGRLDQWDKNDAMTFNKTKHWVLHFGHKKPMQCHGLGWEHNDWKAAQQKRTWRCWSTAS